MNVEFETAAKYIGELVAAANHDHSTASPSDVGLHGVPIRIWREAYAEGCRDMASGIVNKMSEEQQAAIKETVLESYNVELARLVAGAAAPTDALSPTDGVPATCKDSLQVGPATQLTEDGETHGTFMR